MDPIDASVQHSKLLAEVQNCEFHRFTESKKEFIQKGNLSSSEGMLQFVEESNKLTPTVSKCCLKLNDFRRNF